MATAATRVPSSNDQHLIQTPEGHEIVVAADPYAQKITEGSGVTYVAIAPIGTAQATAAWQARKITVSGADTIITWAGSGAFNQVATDLTALTYA